jgi:hypothetical protein
MDLCSSSPLVVATASPLMGRALPIAYISHSLAMVPIFSRAPYTLISVNRLNSAVIVVIVFKPSVQLASKMSIAFEPELS